MWIKTLRICVHSSLRTAHDSKLTNKTQSVSSKARSYLVISSSGFLSALPSLSSTKKKYFMSKFSVSLRIPRLVGGEYKGSLSSLSLVYHNLMSDCETLFLACLISFQQCAVLAFFPITLYHWNTTVKGCQVLPACPKHQHQRISESH